MFQGEPQARSQNVIQKRFVACIYRWTVLKTHVFIAKKTQSYAYGLEISNCIIEDLPFYCEFSTIKKVVDGVHYHTTQIT